MPGQDITAELYLQYRLTKIAGQAARTLPIGDRELVFAISPPEEAST